MTPADAIQLLEARLAQAVDRDVCLTHAEAIGIADAMRYAVDASVYAPKPDNPARPKR